MIATISPSVLKGHLRAPASKSSMQRALAAALIKQGETIIHNPGHSNDDKAATEIIRLLGAKIEMVDDAMKIKSEGVKPIQDTIDCGESGLSIRMFTPLIALSEQEIFITGKGSLVSRPMDFFDEILPKLGVEIRSNKGKLPLKIKGPLRPGDIEVDGSLSSQFLTGLLMAYSASNAKNVSIRVNDLKSKPYIDLTLDVLKQFGMPVPVNNNYVEFIFDNPQSSLPHSLLTTRHSHHIEYTVESDWSNAAFLLVAGAIAGPIMITGLDLSSTQADKKIIDALMTCNATIAMEAKGIKIRPGEMNAFSFDATDSPDLFPPLVALAVYCEGVSVIKGVSRLIHKESDRVSSLKEEFGKLGVEIKIDGDEMIIRGAATLQSATVHSHHDHRIAMALAIVSLKAPGKMEIEEAGAVNKSYPGFFADLKKLGADVSLV